MKQIRRKNLELFQFLKFQTYTGGKNMLKNLFVLMKGMLINGNINT